MTSRLIVSVLSDRLSGCLMTKIEGCKSSDYFGCQVTDYQDPVLEYFDGIGFFLLRKSAVGVFYSSNQLIVIACRIDIKKGSRPTIVLGYPKASFSKTRTMRCKKGSYSFPWIASLFTLDTYLIMLSG